jgi:WD40 repeat protein
MKWFVDLYGHRLPALTLDISSDSTLLVSGSADKNIKIWGLDFGDCHKSLFAHQDSVMAVRFVPRTHYVLTAGKDRMVKYWDADKFELLLELPGHHGEVRWRISYLQQQRRAGDVRTVAANPSCCSCRRSSRGRAAQTRRQTALAIATVLASGGAHKAA